MADYVRCLILLLILSGTVSEVLAADFTACIDPDPPPWGFWVRDAHGEKTGKLEGFSLALVDKAFAKIGRTVDIRGEYPWQRCLLLVERGQIDFAIDGYYSDERATRFSYSVHFNTLTPQVFYRKGSVLGITHKADLKRYHGCGMIDSSYAHYGLKQGELDLGVTSHDVLVARLLAGRCDYFVEELEIVAGFRMIGKDYLADGQISHAPVVDASGPTMHLLTALRGRGRAMLPELDRAITELIVTHDAERLWLHYAPGLPYRP